MTATSDNILDRLKARADAIRSATPVTKPTPKGRPPMSIKPPVPKAVPPTDLAIQSLRDKAADDMAKRQGQLASAGFVPDEYAEVERIVRLPVVMPMDDGELEEYSRRHVQAGRFNEGWRLFPTQANGVSAYERYNGALLPIGVGFGKTLIDLMVANKAYQKGLRKGVLFVPSSVLEQLVQIDIPWARQRVAITYPIMVVGGRTQRERRMIAGSGKKGLYVLTYSILSTADSVDVLNAINPDFIICDEAQHLKNLHSARTRRLMKFIEEREPTPEGVALSGTITRKSVMDYWHLLKWCLKDLAPLPLSSHLAREWAAVIDAEASDGEASGSGGTGPLMPLVEWARAWFPRERFALDRDGFRKAYRKRLNTSPGVYSSGDAAIGTSLIIHNDEITGYEQRPGWELLDKLRRDVEELWVTPDGDEIEHAIHVYKWLYEICGGGFYNKLSWPTPEEYASRHKLDAAEAEELLAMAKKHHAAGQDYARLLRKYLKGELKEKPQAHADTPMLIGAEMFRNKDKNVPGELYERWAYHRSLDFQGRPERDSQPVRLCDFKIVAAVRWADAVAKAGEGGLIWVYHNAVGQWAHEALAEAGLPVLYCPAGPAGNTAILDPANAKKIVVASLSAHGTGKNLQAFQNNYFLQWPRPATDAEQTIGRTHRSGQAADELIVWTNTTLDFDTLNFAACLNDALYIHQTMGSRQKLIYATYDPVPKVFPSAVLRERGFQNERLTPEQERMLREKFGQG